MSSVTLTNRELKNKATGIDIFVPRHENIPGTFGGTVVYHVIVVTQLFYFKTPGKHKESDVIQFMIPEKYEVFEELCHKLSQKFPSVVLPSSPKKSLLVNDSVSSERRRHMEAALAQISRTPKLACSSLVLEFLGAKRGHKEINRLEDTHTEEDTVGEKNTKEEAVEDVDLFASTDDKDGRQQDEDLEEEDSIAGETSSSLPTSSAVVKGFSVFGNMERDRGDNDDDINDLFIPAGAEEKTKLEVEVEDNSQLLNIEDDLDKLLTVKSKPQKPPKPEKPVPKPRLKPKPDLKPKPAPKPRFEEAAAGEEALFGGTPPKQDGGSRSVKGSERKTDDQDLFVQARKQSFRKPTNEEETLEDIFKTPSTTDFTSTEDDDDLFKQASAAESVDSMTVDDIASYIQHNMPESDAKLDLF